MGFLQYIINTKQYSKNDIYGFELGNEVNQGQPYKVPTVQSNAFHTLHRMLLSMNASDFTLFGPDIHSYTLREDEAEFDYLPNFAEEACDAVDGLTYHCYINQNGSQLLTPDGLNEQYRESVRVSNIFANKSLCPKLANNIIAGEIAEHNQGGGGLTNTYLDGIWYLDALGTLSRLGHSIFARQTLAMSAYGLLDDAYNPNPDYFTGLLFKNLMSNLVLDVHSNDEYFRIYAHCSRTVDNGVSMAYVNINDKPVNVTFADAVMGAGDVEVYMLTPFDTSKRIIVSDHGIEWNGIKIESGWNVAKFSGKASGLECGNYSQTIVWIFGVCQYVDYCVHHK